MASGTVALERREKEHLKEHPPLSPQTSISLPNVTYVDISSRAEDIQAGLVDTFLNLEKIDKNLFLARHLLKGRNSLPVVYGGQVIGQALSAATATVGNGFLPNSLHSYFVQGGDVNMPILYMVDRIRDGKSFCTRLVKAVQSGDAIFTVQISFHRPEPDSIKHQVEMPKVAGPDGLMDWNQLMEHASKVILFRKGFIPSMALTLDHSIWMHNDKFRVDDWLLYENHSTIASGARTLIEGKLWTRDGRLVFSTAQEALIRAPKTEKLSENGTNGTK
ncbi:putative acyl-CoA thioesterase II [Oesophagostomum dentatum]|uniref:Putative acyl-CoA thioesterase II n=1 Tax=Oesophagostomum dentatum TaxID=61180 RepID=A0A0B1T8K5_OESDE|nr:putative acyl-CoA thioesterase II [Oesophagostomum dentatum]